MGNIRYQVGDLFKKKTDLGGYVFIILVSVVAQGQFKCLVIAHDDNARCASHFFPSKWVLERYWNKIG